MGLKAGDSVLGRYDVIDVLGRGGMGEVHRGRHRLLGHTVALKVLTDASEDTQKRFPREAKLMVLVRSPYIVAILDFGHTPENEPCIAMEYIEGEELRVRLRRTGAMPWTDAVTLVRDIA
jgi:serine/threonine protein kinase